MQFVDNAFLLCTNLIFFFIYILQHHFWKAWLVAFLPASSRRHGCVLLSGSRNCKALLQRAAFAPKIYHNSPGKQQDRKCVSWDLRSGGAGAPWTSSCQGGPFLPCSGLTERCPATTVLWLDKLNLQTYHLAVFSQC